MIKKMFGLLILMTYINCYSQNNGKKALELVQVSDWNGTFFMVSDYFWNTAKDDLIKQMGAEEYEKAKKFSKYENMPKEMCIMVNSTTRRDPKEFFAKMCSLKFYKIAKVTMLATDKGTGGTDILLMAPYAENKNWDPQAKWDTVYFLIKEEFVKYLERKSNDQVK